MSDERPEIGVQCSCGFRKRATQINEDGTWNGRQVEGLHWYQIEKERAADALKVTDAAAREPIQTPVTRAHSISIGIFATMEWPALTGEEQAIGEAFWIGYWQGQNHLRARLAQRLARVTAEEFDRE